MCLSDVVLFSKFGEVGVLNGTKVVRKVTGGSREEVFGRNGEEDRWKDKASYQRPITGNDRSSKSSDADIEKSWC